MSLTLTIRRGVAVDVRSALHGFSRFIRATVDVPHRLTVKVVNEPAVAYEGNYGFGLFVRWRNDPRPEIWLAGGLASVVEAFEGDRQAALEEIVHTYAHELAHYEQFRDGRKVQERGVEVRARNIVKQYDQWRATRGRKAKRG